MGAEQLLEEADALAQGRELVLGAAENQSGDSRGSKQLPDELLGCAYNFALEGFDLQQFI